MASVSAVRPFLAACPAAEAQARLSRFLADAFGEAERALIADLKSDKRRLDWVAGRLAAKQAAGRFLASKGSALAAPQIVIENDADGRPSVAGEEVYISISHCPLGGLAAAHHAPVGVDFEPVAPRDPAVIEYFAREDEPRATPREQTALWVVKEAVLKMLGTGIAAGPKNVKWDGAKAELFGAALEAWKKHPTPYTVQQWFDGDTAVALAFQES